MQMITALGPANVFLLNKNGRKQHEVKKASFIPGEMSGHWTNPITPIKTLPAQNLLVLTPKGAVLMGSLIFLEMFGSGWIATTYRIQEIQLNVQNMAQIKEC